MIKKLIFAVSLFLSVTAVNSQDLIGTWKPVSFRLGNLMEGNIEKDQILFPDSTKENEMQQMMGTMLLQQLKHLTETYRKDGSLELANNKEGKTSKGVYQFDTATSTLRRGQLSAKEETYQLVFKPGQIIELTTKIQAPTGEKIDFIVEFQRVINYKF